MHERILKSLLRVVGTLGLTAVVAVVMPYSWMDVIHRWLGMGPLPSDPIVGYLARSTSAFYAIFGGLFWVISFDIRRHSRVLCYVGAAAVVFGAALLVIDVVEGLPLHWTLSEGPLNAAFGVYFFIAARRLDDLPASGNQAATD
ncbi:MAG: hypothetical protein ACYS8Z_03590 [Planctomycetota bacterium]